ncbi:MAG: hypothetical protein KGQ59_06450 [Bdellovibrionales bacterium]|nr:hypothetical protein [Bdellovibrionales bacterium]
MELNQDWRKLQSTFFPSIAPTRKGAASSPAGAVYCIHDQDIVTLLFAEGEDLSDWTGASLADVRSQFSNRVVLEFERKALEASLLSSVAQPHLEAQIAQWREDAQAKLVATAAGHSVMLSPSRKDQAFLDQWFITKKNFLLESLNGSWWARVLPSAFGIFLRFEGLSGGSAGSSTKEFLLIYRKGQLEQFGVPDLGFIGSDRRKDPEEVCKYLADRCMVPVQAVLLREEDWLKWASEKNPWSEIAWAVQSSRVQLVPFRWSVVSLIASRGLLGL